jgi:hypothetical protein
LPGGGASTSLRFAIVDLTDEQILERLLALNRQRIVDEKPATKRQPRGSRAKTGDEFVSAPDDFPALIEKAAPPIFEAQCIGFLGGAPIH